MSRLKIGMKLDQQLFEMSGGNPGAVRALIECHRIDESIVRKLDDMEIYGPNIWLCFKDINGFDAHKMVEGINDGSIKEKLEALPYYRKEDGEV